MAKSQITFNKKEKEKNRLKKRQDKQKKKEERKLNPQGGEFEDMIAYVDEFGSITSTPPDPMQRREITAETIEVSVPKKEKEEEITVRTGIVDFYNDSKGFGFIRELGNQEKYFFHVNGLLEEVTENNKVTFELEKGMKGMNAVRIKKA
jgi:cold shock CspA family protein